MKENEIFAKLAEYHIAPYLFTNYLEKNKLPHKNTFRGGLEVDESILDDYLNGEGHKYVEKVEKEKEVQQEKLQRMFEEAAIEAEERKAKNKELAKILITSGFNFDGYTIKKYSGYISGDDAISVSRGYAWENVSVRDELLASLSRIRRNALHELKEAAYDLGCNAVIGVDFDYITLDPQTANLSGGTTYQPYVFCVTANGNAVIIEKDED